MYITKTIFLIFGLLIFLSQINAEVYMSVSGKAIDAETKMPVKDVAVSLYGSDLPVAPFSNLPLRGVDTTDENGLFYFDKIEEGKANVRWEPPGPPCCVHDTSAVSFYVSKGKNITNLTILVSKGVKLSGVVYYGNSSDPFPGVNVNMMKVDFTHLDRDVYTDENGYFEFGNICPGTKMRIVLRKYISGEEKYATISNDTAINFNFNVDITTGINMTVLDSLNKPVEWEMLQILSEKEHIFGIFKGLCKIRGIKAGKYCFKISNREKEEKLSYDPHRPWPFSDTLIIYDK
ncbi:MAG: hypothetical protein ABH885_06965, partial [Candidatus Omnitrophota bacterium]